MAAKPSLEELLEGVDPSRLSQPCKDHHLSEVALYITEWRSIAPFLRLRKGDEEQILTEFPNDLRAQKIAMLRRWREKRGHKATYQELAEVFWKLDILSLVEEVRNVAISECSSSESEGESEQGCVRDSGSQRWTVPRYASYLKGRYRTTRPPVLSLQWPPPPIHTVFNLALIQKQRLEFGPNEELVRLLQRGQIKEAAESHMQIELSNILKADNKEREVVLIEGAPGSGKSTLAWHICQQWEKQELFTKYEVVVFVQLRDLELQSATSVAEILPVECANIARDIAALLTRSGRWGRGVLLVLDGWDELQPDCPLHSHLLQLIAHPASLNMHFSSVIITTRPVSSGELQRHASSRVEVLGFKPEQVQEYFKACFGSDHQLYTRLVAQLKERCIIEASCFLPLNAVIVVHTFCACNHHLPHTLHRVFEELVLSCIVRHVTDRSNTKSDITASHLHDLPHNIEVPLSTLSSLAFHGICVNKAVFSETDLKEFKLPVDLSTTLSLVQVVESFRNCRRSKSYNFFHLQIQELLAAYHISKLEEDEQIKIFKDLFGQHRFAAVFQFYAAFTKLQTKGIREVLMDMINSNTQLSTVLQCVYEAQDPSLCQFIGWALHTYHVKESSPLFFLSSQSNPLYIIALGYFLCCHCYYSNEEVSVSICQLHDVNFKLLVREFLQHQSHFTTPFQHHNYGSIAFCLQLSRGNCWETFVQSATELLRSLKPFVTTLVLDLSDNETFRRLSSSVSQLCRLIENATALQCFELLGFGERKVMNINEHHLTLVHSINSIKHLSSFTCKGIHFQISQSALKAICRVMATNSAIKYLTLHNCHFHLKDSARPLVHSIHFSNTIKIIDLSGSSLGVCVSALLMGLACNTSVVELLLENCKVVLTEENGQALCYMLKMNKSLRALNVRSTLSDSHHSVDLQAACAGLIFNASLVYIDLSLCQLRVTKESGLALLHMLQTNTTLKSLKLDGNQGVSNEGAVYLAQGLAQNRGLETLSVVKCGISTAVVELAEALKTNNCLLSLDMSYNDVGERFVHIVRSLHINSTLRDLRARWCSVKHNAIIDIVRSSLESLDLSHNSIGDEGTVHIAQLVTKSRSLEQLKLEVCHIGDRGVECLASALEVNTSLKILHIRENKFTDTGLLALGRSLKMNKTLKTVNVVGCATPAGMKLFVLSLCENECLTDLCVAYDHSNKVVRNEVNKVNQVRRNKNCNTLSTFAYRM